MATNMIQSSVPLCLPCSASNDPIEFAFAVPARFLPEIAAVPRKHFCQRSLMSSQHHSSPHFLAWRSSDIYHFQRHVNDHFTAWQTDCSKSTIRKFTGDVLRPSIFLPDSESHLPQIICRHHFFNKNLAHQNHHSSTNHSHNSCRVSLSTLSRHD
jgi:hypothetical protein